MAKVIIKENGIEVYSGTLGGGSAFLKKHPLYLNHINQGFRKLSYKVPYEIYIDGKFIEPTKKIIAKDFNAPVEVGTSFKVDGTTFNVEEIINLPYNNYMIVINNGKEKFGFSSDRVITLNSLYTRIKRIM